MCQADVPCGIAFCFMLMTYGFPAICCYRGVLVISLEESHGMSDSQLSIVFAVPRDGRPDALSEGDARSPARLG